MPRGGYQKPSKPAAVSGPGRFSKRTDGQPTRSPDLDTPGQKFGDRSMIEAAQKVAPARGAAGAKVRNMAGSAPTRGKLPSWLFGMDSALPSEPVTSGLAMGAGPGPEALDAAQPPDDIREVVLNYLATTFQNPTAIRHLTELRNERASTQPTDAPMPVGPSLDNPAELQPPTP